MKQGTAGRRFFSPSLFRYTWNEVLPGFVAGTTLFLLIMLMAQAIRLSEFVVTHNVGLGDMGRLCWYLLMSLVGSILPIAFLFAVLMGVSRANSEGEILALQVNGIGLAQIFAPVVVLSTLVGVGSLYTSMYSTPRGNRAFELLVTRLYRERVMERLKPGIFIGGFHGLLLFAEQVVPLKNEMKRVFIYDEREEANPLAITAQAGILRSEPEKGVLTLRLSDGAIHLDKKTVDPNLLKIEFDIYDINLNVGGPGDFWRDYSPPSYTYPQLMQRIEETRPNPPEHRKLQVELHRRIALAFGCIVFGALGFFIGILSQRGVRGIAIVFCVIVGLVYWLSILAANALAARGWLIPWLGVWLPNLFFLGVAHLCWRKYRGLGLIFGARG